MPTYTISITASCFGTRKTFYNNFAKGNRIVQLENVEFEGNGKDHKNPQHNTGTLIDTLTVSDDNSLVEVVKDYIKENGFQQECFTVVDAKGDEVLTEDDIE